MGRTGEPPATGRPVAGMLLTGGSSRRMGRDKATLVVDGAPLATRVGAVLAAAVDGPLVEVGPGVSGLPAVREEPPGAGPLVAIAAGAAALRGEGHTGPALVVAVDLPLVTAAVLRRLASHPGDDSVMPVVAGRAQPLCARWSTAAMAAAADLAVRGERRAAAGLAAAPVVELVADRWERALSDVDEPDDLVRLGLDQHTGRE